MEKEEGQGQQKINRSVPIIQKRRLSMPEFGTPFSGLAKDRKLTKSELIRAIRFMIAAEYEAIQLYMHQFR